MVSIRRMLLALAVAPWTGLAFVHLMNPLAFRHDLRGLLGVSGMLVGYGYAAELLFALPILLIGKKSRNPSVFVAIVWSSLAASAIVPLILAFVTGGHLTAPDLWMSATPKYMWPYWFAGSLSGLTYLAIVRRPQR